MSEDTVDPILAVLAVIGGFWFMERYGALPVVLCCFGYVLYEGYMQARRD